MPHNEVVMRHNFRVIHGRFGVTSARHRRRRTAIPWRAVGLAATATALLAVGAVTAINLRWTLSPVRAGGCSDILSVAVDLSDPAGDLVRQRIVDRLDGFSAASCLGTRTLISQFRPKESEPIQLLFNRNDPGKSGELPMETKMLVEQRREREFLVPLRAQLERALVPDRRDQSLIVEGLSYHSRLPIFQGQSPEIKKSLWIVSDLLQHSNRCTMYAAARARSPLPWSAIEKLCRPVFDDFPILLKGTEVEVLWIKRGRGKNGAELQPATMQEFYENLFKSAGAKNVVWLPM
jgi:hypothetical protein